MDRMGEVGYQRFLIVLLGVAATAANGFGQGKAGSRAPAAGPITSSATAVSTREVHKPRLPFPKPAAGEGRKLEAAIVASAGDVKLELKLTALPIRGATDRFG